MIFRGGKTMHAKYISENLAVIKLMIVFRSLILNVRDLPGEVFGKKNIWKAINAVRIFR